jgi:TonB family protein
MKLCRTCGEEFSDKFVFCPVDGSALNGASAPVAAEPAPVVVSETPAAADTRTTFQSVSRQEETAATTAAAPSGNGASRAAAVPPVATAISEETVAARRPAQERGEYHLTMLVDEGVTRRLTRELQGVAHEYELTWPEFKRDPGGFTKRMAAGYGAMLKRFFAQPYVTLATLAGVLGMTMVVMMLVFPYNAVYKWFASDGKLVADVGMSLEEIRTNSTLKLGEGAPAAAGNGAAQPQLMFSSNLQAEVGAADASHVTSITGENLSFDFELRGTNQLFEWCHSYLIWLDENQRVKEINVELNDKPEAWSELAARVVRVDERLNERGWRAFQEEEEAKAAFQIAALNTKPAEAPAPVQSNDASEIKWINRDADRMITLSTKPVRQGNDPKATRFKTFLKIEELHRDQLVAMLEIPEEQEKPDKGPAGMAKGAGGGQKPKQEKPGGGGGGGRQEQLPASFGKLPPAALQPQILPPNPHPPTIKNPSLPVVPTINADPTLFPPDLRPLPYGDPKSKSTETSAGPGTGGGIGTGTGGGVGPGDGSGYGPGRGFNTGGGDGRVGGGGPGGGGGGDTDYSKNFNAKDVTRKAVLLSKPEPGFTEEARKNNVTGTVKLRLVLGSSGSVSNISVVKGLPDGLTEKAISAARRITFTPAQKDGRNVSQWVTIEYNFNIY